MSPNLKEEEIEVKFYIRHIDQIKKKLETIGAVLEKPRVFESNLRFDYPDGILSANKQVLRLRRDTENTITYKGPAQINQPVSVREEIEIEVDDFERAKHLLEALGYEVYMEYEKYRTTYAYQDVLIVVDELPIGNFIEIEGPHVSAIHIMTELLGLHWENRIPASYLYLFEQLKKHRPELEGTHLSFAQLSSFQFSESDLALDPGDD
ncbi:MAG: class IV adenylate cyclase [Anaerolineaceae bacterium]|nr:class IV adenylate cyclase [Anaerolineaceae bacterium]